MKSYLIFLILFSVLLVGCSSLEQSNSEIYCGIEKPDYRCKTKPLKSIEEFSEDFKSIIHEWEISLIEGSNYNLILELQKLDRDMTRQSKVYHYNINLLKFKYEANWGYVLNSHPIAYQLKEHIAWADKYRPMKRALSRLIEKLKAIKKASIKQKLQQKKQEKV